MVSAEIRDVALGATLARKTRHQVQRIIQLILKALYILLIEKDFISINPPAFFLVLSTIVIKSVP